MPGSIISARVADGVKERLKRLAVEHGMSQSAFLAYKVASIVNEEELIFRFYRLFVAVQRECAAGTMTAERFDRLFANIEAPKH